MENDKKWIYPHNNGKKFTLQEVCDELLLLISKHKSNEFRNEYKLIVGTDSHISKKLVNFSSSICLQYEGFGGTYFYTNKYVNSFLYKSNKKRLFEEVDISVQLAEEIKLITGLECIVHIDAADPNSKEFSSSFSEELLGYAKAYGYEAYIKPNSFVATNIADKHSK